MSAAFRRGNTHARHANPTTAAGDARPRSAPTLPSAFPAYTVPGPRSRSFKSALPEPVPTEVAMAMPPLFPEAPSPLIPFADLSRATANGGAVDNRYTQAIQMPVLPPLTSHDQTNPSPLVHGQQLGWNYGWAPHAEPPPSHGRHLAAEPFHNHGQLSNVFSPVPAPADDDESEYEQDSDDESVSSDSSSVAPMDTVCVTQNGGLLLKNASGIPVVLIDSDSADVSALFRKHKIQVTNLTATIDDGNNAVNTLHSLATVATGKDDGRKFQRWTEDEDDLLRSAVEKSGPAPHDWKRISRKYFRGIRTSIQVSFDLIQSLVCICKMELL